VGGFASSPYLQTRVLAALQGEVDTVVVPPRPYSAVLNGGYPFEAPPVRGSREAGSCLQQQVPPLWGSREAGTRSQQQVPPLWGSREAGTRSQQQVPPKYRIMAQLISIGQLRQAKRCIIDLEKAFKLSVFLDCGYI